MTLRKLFDCIEIQGDENIIRAFDEETECCVLNVPADYENRSIYGRCNVKYIYPEEESVVFEIEFINE